MAAPPLATRFSSVVWAHHLPMAIEQARAVAQVRLVALAAAMMRAPAVALSPAEALALAVALVWPAKVVQEMPRKDSPLPMKNLY